MRRLVAAVVLVVVGCLVPRPAPAQPPSSAVPAAYTPLVHGWEQFFTITSAVSARRGQPWVDGYVRNNWGFWATRVQLLVDGLDASGNVVSQRVAWLGSQIPPGSRVYFETPAPTPATTYRVSVFAYDWLQSASIQTP